MLIDSHTHLEMKAFDRDRKEVIERAFEGGVTQMITIGTDLSSSTRALELAQQYDFIYSTVGFHPHHAKETDVEQLNELVQLAAEPKVVAWGEMGLDFFRNYSPPERQIDIFNHQLDMVMGNDLPIIIHDREAHKEVIDILKSRGVNQYRGVIHCFSGDYNLAMTFIDMGFYLSIPGNVTYPKAFQTQDVAARIPIERLLIETDAPFLTPLPLRGKRNEPLFVTYTAQKIANLRNMGFQELARKTSENAVKLFHLPPGIE